MLLLNENKKIYIFGEKQTVWFYNSYSPVSDPEKFSFSEQLLLDDRLIYIRDWNFAWVQFHPESIMSVNGFDILKKLILKVV